MRQKLSVFLSLIMCAALLCAAGCTTTEITAGNKINIALSDNGVTVDGTLASANTNSAVYTSGNIIYYESGKGSSYGEGTSAEEHSATEAAKHTVVMITEPGIYELSGKLSAGQIAIDLGTEASTNPNAVVELILNGVDITCTVAPAIIFYNVYETKSTESAGAIITLADSSDNYITGSHVARIYKEGTTDKLHKYDGALYSGMTLIIQGENAGSGILNLNADYEGIETAMHFTMDGGIVRVNSLEDGINSNEDGVSITTINGGYLYVNAGLGDEGDGIDSNGDLIINGGTVISYANPNVGDGGIDADGDIIINGGTVVALGSRNDAAASSSQQALMELSYAALKSEGAIIRITDASGNEILTFLPERGYQSVTISTPEMKVGTTYYVYSGGTNSGVSHTDGLYAKGGSYLGGTQQQYSGNSFGMMGGNAGGFMGGMGGQRPDETFMGEIPENMGTQPDMGQGGMRGQRPDMGQLPDGMTFPENGMQGQTGGQIPDMTVSGEGSTSFTLTSQSHSFSGVADYQS